MGFLNVTLIDVGWGDSIFLEHEDAAGDTHYALIDSNDSKELQSTRIFIERFFRLKRREMPDPLFTFVMLSHPHDDHAKGLKGIISRYGTEYFLHPKSNKLGPDASLLRYCVRSSKVQQYDSACRGKNLPPFGDVTMRTLWPFDGQISDHENDNSIVVTLRYGDVAAVLTGDAEEEAWAAIAADIPDETAFFKVPHHGSRNGSLDAAGQPTWLPHCPATAPLGISCMFRQDYRHPHQEVLTAFDDADQDYFRTDEHYHLTVSLDGDGPPTVHYSHI